MALGVFSHLWLDIARAIDPSGAKELVPVIDRVYTYVVNPFVLFMVLTIALGQASTIVYNNQYHGDPEKFMTSAWYQMFNVFSSIYGLYALLVQMPVATWFLLAQLAEQFRQSNVHQRHSAVAVQLLFPMRDHLANHCPRYERWGAALNVRRLPSPLRRFHHARTVWLLPGCRQRRDHRRAQAAKVYFIWLEAQVTPSPAAIRPYTDQGIRLIVCSTFMGAAPYVA
eukprot:7386373-Prymnesium_polylepis.1